MSLKEGGNMVEASFVINVLVICMICGLCPYVQALPGPLNREMTCAEAPINDAHWNKFFAPMAKFDSGDGLFLTNFTIFISVNGNYVKAITFENNLWVSYVGTGKLRVGLLYIYRQGEGLTLASNNTSNQIRDTDRLCNVYYPPTPQNLRDSYVESIAISDDSFIVVSYDSNRKTKHMNPFDWDDKGITCRCVQFDYVRGAFGTHSVSLRSQMSHTPISLQEARIRLNYTGTHPLTVPGGSQRGMSMGMGVLPMEILDAELQSL